MTIFPMNPSKTATCSSMNFDIIRAYLQMPLFLEEVPLQGEMFGGLPLIKFDDHDLGILGASPSLALELYLEMVMDGNLLKIEPMEWVQGLAGSGILNLLCIPHFG